jgi:hypothetical protein
MGGKKRRSNAPIEALIQHVESAPCVVLRLTDDESQQLTESRLGFSEFTLAKPHNLVADVKTPTLCLVFGKDLPTYSAIGERAARPHLAFIGIIASRMPITTLETRLKIHHAVQIAPDTERAVKQLVKDPSLSTTLRKKLKSPSAVVLLSPRLSGALVRALAGIRGNSERVLALARVLLEAPRRYTSFAAAQEDALRTALKAFGLRGRDRAARVDISDGKPSALVRVPLMEDSVIEHDARSVPGYTLVASDISGRAIFEKHGERLEVFTANRRDLEHVFGVDLIYVNLTKKNMVMVQYKMLEPNRLAGEPTDWLYRPDSKMADEVERMRRFSRTHTPGPFEYRLNHEVFYLKFVKRNGALVDGAVITPLDHYERLVKDPQCKGPRRAVRISYHTLGGRYMRETAFLDLIQSGYIGAYATTTSFLSQLVEAVLDRGRAVVAAVQSENPRN